MSMSQGSLLSILVSGLGSFKNNYSRSGPLGALCTHNQLERPRGADGSGIVVAPENALLPNLTLILSLQGIWGVHVKMRDFRQ